MINCEMCKNYEPKVEEPAPHPGRIFMKDLRIGMVIRRHGTDHIRKLVVITGQGYSIIPGSHRVPALQLRAGFQPHEYIMDPAISGLCPQSGGDWREGAWCEEVK